MGDCGLGWLKKAYQRCERQAEQEGRTLEEVAAERYGVIMLCLTSKLCMHSFCRTICSKCSPWL